VDVQPPTRIKANWVTVGSLKPHETEVNKYQVLAYDRPRHLWRWYERRGHETVTDVIADETWQLRLPYVWKKAAERFRGQTLWMKPTVQPKKKIAAAEKTPKKFNNFLLDAEEAEEAAVAEEGGEGATYELWGWDRLNV
jgi:hypothetical protein